MKMHFSISELCIVNEPIPLDVADKLLRFHIWPMNGLRDALGVSVWASQRSGYRPKSYEREQGRVPTDPSNASNSWSRHTFSELAGKDPLGKGAVDWTTKQEFLTELGVALVNTSPYSRICYYPNEKFYHCDYAYEERGQAHFVNDGGWKELNKREFFERIGHERQRP